MDESNKFFFDYFDARVRFIKDYCLEKIEGLILICCCIDALSGYRHNQKSSFGLFKKFILEHSGEKDIWTKISLPLLKENFKHEGMTKYSDLMIKFGVNEISYLMKGYNTDVSLEELEKRAANYNLVITPFSDEMKIKILKFEYVKILWDKYRNYAIHELRTNPDEPANIFNQTDSVFYNHCNYFDSSGTRREKVRISFPRSFLLRTLEQCLTNLRKYAEKHNITMGPR